MPNHIRAAGGCAALILLLFGGGSAPLSFKAVPVADTLRVCADPNNLPFSNARGEGFENKLAELVARDLKRTVVTIWAPEREHFVKDTIQAGRCDAIMGVPDGFDALDVTRPYYTSSYVFVSRADSHLDLHAITDARLRRLKIGVHLIGDEDTPPTQALGRQGIVANVVGFMIFGDYGKPNPPARLIEAVQSGRIDVAAVWGPIGGYFAKMSSLPLEVSPITGTEDFAPLAFGYQMGMGVRKGDHAMKAALDGVIARHRDEIGNLLQSYGVPITQPNR